MSIVEFNGKKHQYGTVLHAIQSAVGEMPVDTAFGTRTIQDMSIKSENSQSSRILGVLKDMNVCVEDLGTHTGYRGRQVRQFSRRFEPSVINCKDCPLATPNRRQNLPSCILYERVIQVEEPFEENENKQV